MSSSFPSENESSSITIWLLFAALVGLGSFLRLYHFSDPELWIDEYVTQWIVQASTWHEVIQRAGLNHTQSPFYYVIAKLAVDILGPSAFALRLPSVLFGIGTLALAFPLGVTLFRRRHAAILAVAAFAVNHKLIWFTQEARSYSVALFFSMLSFLSYVKLLEADRWAWRVAYILSTTAAYYAHPLFALIVLVHIVHLFCTRGWEAVGSRPWLLSFFGVAVLCLPTVLRMLTLYGSRQGLDWILNLSWTTPIEILSPFTEPLQIAVIVVLLLIVGIRTGTDPPLIERSRRYLIVLWFLLPVAILGLIPPLLGISLLTERYVLCVLPGGIFFLAWLMSLGSTVSWRRWLPLTAYLAFVFASALVPLVEKYGVFAERPYQGWNQATAYLKAFAKPEDLVLYRSGLVEADRLPFSPEDSSMVAFLEAPLNANLPAEHGLAVMGLPYRVNSGTREYMGSVLGQAVQHQRVWLIGVGPPLIQVAQALASVGFRPTEQQEFGRESYYGRVMLLSLEREGGATGYAP